MMLRGRGYSTRRYEALNTAYHNKPTPLQEASYDVSLISLIRKDDVEGFSDMMSCGISSNPCNPYGASIAHMVCRRGNREMLDVLVEKGASLQIADDYGRTPLHDACWAAEPAFDTVKVILKSDARLLHMMDARGHVPLNYVRKEHWADWIKFFEANLEVYWPAEDGPENAGAPPLSAQPANSRPLADPDNALPLDMAKMVASGRMSSEEARLLYPEKDNDTATYRTEGDASNCWDSDDCDSDYEDEDDSCCSDFDEDGLADLLGFNEDHLRFI
jgi:hypothetical protein